MSPPRDQCQKCGYLKQSDGTKKWLSVRHGDHTCPSYRLFNEIGCEICNAKNVVANHYEIDCKRRLSN
jgi:hypothetical protein